jgi:hypothetical protein
MAQGKTTEVLNGHIKCNKCNIWKPLNEFHKQSQNKSGHHGTCKTCLRGDTRKRNPAMSDTERKQRAKLYRSTTDYKEYNKLRMRKWREENRERNLEYYRQYRKNNKQWYRRKEKEYRNRYKKDPIFILKESLRASLRRKLKTYVSKESATVDSQQYLGCSIIEFKEYLEARFHPGMSWRNYGMGEGKWHIDHIRPCASFDLTKESDLKVCFHYTNLQPLWERDWIDADGVLQKGNLSKSYCYFPKTE